MQMFPDPDLAEVLHRDRHHRLTVRRWLNDVGPSPATRRQGHGGADTGMPATIGNPSRLRRAVGR